VTLETKEAAVGGYYKAVMRVPHGCKGSPTLKVRVRIPDGVIGVKPQPKAGWKLNTVKGNYDKTYTTMHGVQTSDGVREIVWTGKLLDEYYDEFAFSAYLTSDLKAGSTLYFPVVQECEKGAERWIDIPAEGSASPAPGLKLLPKS
jgi:uncharacterized protein YcnI